jgi:hypothetical protein
VADLPLTRCRPHVYVAWTGRPYAVGCYCAGWRFDLPPVPTRVDRRLVGRVIRRQWRRHAIETLLERLPEQLTAMSAALERTRPMFVNLAAALRTTLTRAGG